MDEQTSRARRFPHGQSFMKRLPNALCAIKIEACTSCVTHDFLLLVSRDSSRGQSSGGRNCCLHFRALLVRESKKKVDPKIKPPPCAPCKKIAPPCFIYRTQYPVVFFAWSSLSFPSVTYYAGHINSDPDPSRTQKPTYSGIFTKHIWL